jgi:hypothetical protein
MHPGDSTDSRPGRRTQLAEILAGMPDVIGRLIFEHVPDEHDRCRGCTSPGTGRPKDPCRARCASWPTRPGGFGSRGTCPTPIRAIARPCA